MKSSGSLRRLSGSQGCRFSNVLVVLPASPVPRPQAGGKVGGKTALVAAFARSLQLALAGVFPVRSLCGRKESRPASHGKEKVYGSIP
jgi:hypothetical protein